MPATSPVASPARPAVQPPVDCSPMRKEHPVMAYACDALVRTQTARPVASAEAPAVKPARPARAEKVEVKVDPRFIPVAMFGVGGPGLGLYLLNVGKLVPGLLALGLGVLVASSIVRGMAAERR